MSNLKMEIYTQSTGVQLTLAWDNEEEYQLGKDFLANLGALWFERPSDNAGKPNFVYLKNINQLEALYEFRRFLREKAK